MVHKKRLKKMEIFVFLIKVFQRGCRKSAASGRSAAGGPGDGLYGGEKPTAGS